MQSWPRTRCSTDWLRRDWRSPTSSRSRATKTARRHDDASRGDLRPRLSGRGGTADEPLAASARHLEGRGSHLTRPRTWRRSEVRVLGAHRPGARPGGRARRHLGVPLACTGGCRRVRAAVVCGLLRLGARPAQPLRSGCRTASALPRPAGRRVGVVCGAPDHFDRLRRLTVDCIPYRVRRGGLASRTRPVHLERARRIEPGLVVAGQLGYRTAIHGCCGRGRRPADNAVAPRRIVHEATSVRGRGDARRAPRRLGSRRDRGGQLQGRGGGRPLACEPFGGGDGHGALALRRRATDTPTPGLGNRSLVGRRHALHSRVAVAAHEAVGARVNVNGAQPTIVVDSVSRWFAGVVAVSGVSLEIEPGVTALLGPNGAGKTTLLRAIAGLIGTSQGKVSIFGEPVRGNLSLYRRIGYMTEHESVYDFLTGRQFVDLNARLQGVEDLPGAVERAIETVDLVGAQHRRLHEYSRGMRQRMRLAATLVHDPPLLLLDEPLSGTDPAQRLHLRDVIRRLGAEGRTVVVSSHILEEIDQVADRIP